MTQFNLICLVLQALAVLRATAAILRKLCEQYSKNAGYNDTVCYYLSVGFTALSSRVSTNGARLLWVQRSLLRFFPQYDLQVGARHFRQNQLHLN